jgi:hypothetical protein
VTAGLFYPKLRRAAAPRVDRSVEETVSTQQESSSLRPIWLDSGFLNKQSPAGTQEAVREGIHSHTCESPKRVSRSAMSKRLWRGWGSVGRPL